MPRKTEPIHTHCQHEWVDWYEGPMATGRKFWECKKCGARQYQDDQPEE